MVPRRGSLIRLQSSRIATDASMRRERTAVILRDGRDPVQSHGNRTPRRIPEPGGWRGLRP